MEEQVLFERGSVKVTTLRFIVGAQTFAMSNITSVRSSVDEPSGCAGIALMVIGAAIALASLAGSLFGFVVGAALCLGGWSVLHSQHPEYQVRLTTAGGESTALASPEKEYVASVVQALNDAIVARG